MVELTTTHMREQTEILTAQAKQLAEMAQKLLPKMGDFKIGDFKMGDFKGLAQAPEQRIYSEAASVIALAAAASWMPGLDVDPAGATVCVALIRSMVRTDHRGRTI